ARRTPDLRGEQGKLPEASATLAKRPAELDEIRERIGATEEKRSAEGEKLGGVNQAVSQARATGREARTVLAEPAGEAASTHFDAIRELLTGAGQETPDKPELCDRAEGRAAAEIGDRAD